MADAADSKSADGNIVGVQVPPPAPSFARASDGKPSFAKALRYEKRKSKKPRRGY